MISTVSRRGSVFSLLHRTFGDEVMEAVFSEASTVESWLRTEAALAQSQALHGDITAQQHSRRFSPADETPLFLIAQSPPVCTRAESYADFSRTRFTR